MDGKEERNRASPSQTLSAFLLLWCLCFYHRAGQQQSLKRNRAAAMEPLLNGKWAWTLIWTVSLCRREHCQRLSKTQRRERQGCREDGSPYWPSVDWRERNGQHVEDSQWQWSVLQRDLWTGTCFGRQCLYMAHLTLWTVPTMSTISPLWVLQGTFAACHFPYLSWLISLNNALTNQNKKCFR